MKALLMVVLVCLIAFDAMANEVKLIATGDIMAHMGNIKAAKTATGYDFAQFFGPSIVKLLKSGDLVIGNLETRMAGANRGYSGFPAFNAPAELASDLKSIGFNFLTTANNHVLDKGVSGVERTNALLTRLGFGHTGSFTNGRGGRFNRN